MRRVLVGGVLAVAEATHTVHGWERNASCAVNTLALEGSLRQLVSSYEIDLFNDLTQRAKEDQFGNRLAEFQDRYKTFAQRTGCLSWDSVVQQRLTRYDVIALQRGCLCTHIRLTTIGSVRSLYGCDLLHVKQGSLHEAYATLGRRINTIHRFQIGLYGGNEILSLYDELFRLCYSRFFERVGSEVTRDLASPVLQPQHEAASGDAFLSLAIVALATFVFVNQWLQPRREEPTHLFQPPPEPVDPRHDPNGVGHPD